MLREGINGFCMALADSVPGVSGGTVAFIMGFIAASIPLIVKEEQESLVVKILENLKPDQRAAILSKMSVTNAADLTTKMEQ